MRPAYLALPSPAMATRKRKGKAWKLPEGSFPSLMGAKPAPLPAPLPPPSGPAASLTTGHMVKQPEWECLRCERLKLGKGVEGLDHSPRCEWRGKGDPAVG